MHKTRLNLILSFTSLCLTMCLLIVTLFAWYTENHNVQTSGVTALTSNNDTIQFENTVTAVRTKLDGEIVTDTYTVSPSTAQLFLTKRVIKDEHGITTSTEDHTLEEAIPFKILELLPDEYIDITVGYYFADQDDKDYNVSFNNITGGSFEIEAFDETTNSDIPYTHYATGAFKYKSISLKDSGNTDVIDFSHEEYQWISEYDINNNDETNIKLDLLSHTWQSSYQKLYYTFRIYEDFSQYYRLIAQASKSYGALLSDLELKIDSIFFKA